MGSFELYVLIKIEILLYIILPSLRKMYNFRVFSPRFVLFPFHYLRFYTASYSLSLKCQRLSLIGFFFSFMLQLLSTRLNIGNLKIK